MLSGWHDLPGRGCVHPQLPNRLWLAGEREPPLHSESNQSLCVIQWDVAAEQQRGRGQHNSVYGTEHLGINRMREDQHGTWMPTASGPGMYSVFFPGASKNSGAEKGFCCSPKLWGEQNGLASTSQYPATTDIV